MEGCGQGSENLCAAGEATQGTYWKPRNGQGIRLQIRLSPVLPSTSTMNDLQQDLLAWPHCLKTENSQEKVFDDISFHFGPVFQGKKKHMIPLVKWVIWSYFPSRLQRKLMHWREGSIPGIHHLKDGP